MDGVIGRQGVVLGPAAPLSGINRALAQDSPPCSAQVDHFDPMALLLASDTQPSFIG